MQSPINPGGNASRGKFESTGSTRWDKELAWMDGPEAVRAGDFFLNPKYWILLLNDGSREQVIIMPPRNVEMVNRLPIPGGPWRRSRKGP
jgi:hypothetical protein